MSGLLMMLKSFGIDPQEIMKSVGEFRDAAIQCVQALNAHSQQLERIEQQNAQILAQLTELINGTGKQPEQGPASDGQRNSLNGGSPHSIAQGGGSGE